MESVKRLREPAAWVIIAVLALTVVLGLVQLFLLGPRVQAGYAPALASRMGSPTLFVLLSAVVASCVLIDPIKRARGLVITASIVEGIALLAAVVLTVFGFTSAALVTDLIVLLLSLVVSGLAVTLLIKLAPARPARAVPSSLPPQPVPAELPAPVPPEPDPQLQPTWAPDAAAGAAWLTAGDAAAGAPATGWGSPSGPAGWQPIPGPPASAYELESAPDSTTLRPPPPPRTDDLRPPTR